MEIAEAKHRKRKLEQDVQNAIADFQKETGIQVKSVGVIKSYTNVDGSPAPVIVEIETDGI